MTATKSASRFKSDGMIDLIINRIEPRRWSRPAFLTNKEVSKCQNFEECEDGKESATPEPDHCDWTLPIMERK